MPPAPPLISATLPASPIGVACASLHRSKQCIDLAPGPELFAFWKRHGCSSGETAAMGRTVGPERQLVNRTPLPVPGLADLEDPCALWWDAAAAGLGQHPLGRLAER